MGHVILGQPYRQILFQDPISYPPTVSVRPASNRLTSRRSNPGADTSPFITSPASVLYLGQLLLWPSCRAGLAYRQIRAVASTAAEPSLLTVRFFCFSESLFALDRVPKVRYYHLSTLLGLPSPPGPWRAWKPDIASARNGPHLSEMLS